MIKNLAKFQTDQTKCIGCSQCTKVCPGGLIYIDKNHKAAIKNHTEYGWNGCWQCQHCMAVCPRGAISVLGRHPKNSIAPPERKLATSILSALVTNGYPCHQYHAKNVPTETIREILDLLTCAPNGGNKQQVEFTLIDNKAQMDWFRNLVYAKIEELSAKGICPEGFDKTSYEDMKRWENMVQSDMLFCGAPHLLIPHAPLGQGTAIQDVVIAGTYFELLCASRGLGVVMLNSLPDIMKNMPEIWSMLGIPENHYVGMMIGFGLPKTLHTESVQKTLEQSRINRLVFIEQAHKDIASTEADPEKPEHQVEKYTPNLDNALEEGNLTASTLSTLVVNRHSCRRYHESNVPTETINEMLDLLSYAPNSGNKQQVEFTLIDNKAQMDWFRNIAYTKMEELAAKGIYPEGFDKTSYEDMKRWEDTVRPDMLFCGAPHLLIPHAPLEHGTAIQDVVIAATYFELLCASRGLGAVMLTFPLDAMKNMPEIWSMLGIPENHYVGMLIGFGFPKILYARGVQKTLEPNRINRPVLKKEVYTDNAAMITELQKPNQRKEKYIAEFDSDLIQSVNEKQHQK